MQGNEVTDLKGTRRRTGGTRSRERRAAYRSRCCARVYIVQLKYSYHLDYSTNENCSWKQGFDNEGDGNTGNGEVAARVGVGRIGPGKAGRTCRARRSGSTTRTHTVT